LVSLGQRLGAVYGRMRLCGGKARSAQSAYISRGLGRVPVLGRLRHPACPRRAVSGTSGWASV